MMGLLWILLAAIVGSTIAIVYFVWRRWIAPWRRIEQLVRQIGRGGQPRTFLVGGARSAQRVAGAFEKIFFRQKGLYRKIGERAAGQKAILSAMQDGLLVVDGHNRLALINPAFRDLFGLDKDSLGAPLLENVRDPAVKRIVAETLRQRKPSRGQLVIGRRELEMTSEPMGNDKGDRTGAEGLCHGINKLKRVSEMWPDIVANSAHE